MHDTLYMYVYILSEIKLYYYIYYTSRKLYQHMKYSYRRKHIVIRLYIWCKLVTGHTTVTIGEVYRCPNITKENNEKIHNAISEVSKGDYYNGGF